MATSPLGGSLLVAVFWLVVAGLGLAPARNSAFARRFALPLCSPARRTAGFHYHLIEHLGAIAILLCFGLLHGGRGDYSFEALRAAELQPGWATAAFLLAFFGFGAKAGVIPLHAWLPEAHPAAPSPVSALMSGIMLKTAIYGMVRVIF